MGLGGLEPETLCALQLRTLEIYMIYIRLQELPTPAVDQLHVDRLDNVRSARLFTQIENFKLRHCHRKLH